MGFIYKVTNIINGKVYVGKTNKSIEARWQQHIYDSKRLNDRPFYNAINKYGQENFVLELIEQVEDELLNEREKYWIKEYNSYIGFNNSNGYNATLGGDGTIKYNYKKIVDDYNNTKSKVQTAKNMDCSLHTVTNALENFQINTYSNCAGRQICAFNEDICLSFKSIKQAAEYLATINGKNSQTMRKRITSVINHKQNQKAYGYYWKLM